MTIPRSACWCSGFWEHTGIAFSKFPTESRRSNSSSPQPPGYFGVIIIDSRMPGLSGLDVARRIQAARPGQRMLHVTGNPEDLSDERFAELGLQTLAKPLRARELKAAVEAALG